MSVLKEVIQLSKYVKGYMECSRLSGDAAPRAEWRCSRGRVNSVSSYHDDRGAGVSNARPDFREENAVKREDGTAQKDDGGERGGTEWSPQKNDPEQPSEETENPNANDRRNKELSKDVLRTRHVPGGTWLSKLSLRNFPLNPVVEDALEVFTKLAGKDST
ncbi:hypothetical protein NDU88_002415 [Pleurodeles waltl]|uniref:Uncharacterized protein n=1 Tax=Pleurodeles waltl TaxID=8319 RepID=A0AAV7VCG5_PLEWA|nr:hypothetical protein NDU88_002415 [Pleurodeles waltl]